MYKIISTLYWNVDQGVAFLLSVRPVLNLMYVESPWQICLIVV